jgi:hypothetical protein
MNEGDNWEAIPEEVVIDCAQLTKANSIEGLLTQILVELIQDIDFVTNREQERQCHSHLHAMVES